MAKENKKVVYSALSIEELRNSEKQIRENIFKLKIQKVTGQLADTSQLKKNRKELARVMNCLSVKNKKTENQTSKGK